MKMDRKRHQLAKSTIDSSKSTKLWPTQEIRITTKIQLCLNMSDSFWSIIVHFDNLSLIASIFVDFSNQSNFSSILTFFSTIVSILTIFSSIIRRLFVSSILTFFRRLCRFFRLLVYFFDYLSIISINCRLFWLFVDFLSIFLRFCFTFGQF